MVMTARDVLARAAALGVRLVARDGKVGLFGPQEAIAALRPAVLRHKPELLRLLAANDGPAERHARWLVTYHDRKIEVWTSPPATRAEMLASRPGAISAEPIEERQAPEPASCTHCQHRPPGHPPGSPAPCGSPAAAGLAERDGVIRYHPRGGTGCPAFEPRLDPALELRIKQMGRRWGYGEDDLERALEAARGDPAGWLRVVEIDEQGGVPC